MADSTRRPARSPDSTRHFATHDAPFETPPNLVTELLASELYLRPRADKPSAVAISALGEELGPPFRRGRGGPGGWILLDQPELHLGPDILLPDLAGWRRDRMPRVLADAPHFTLVPDWICEVRAERSGAAERAARLATYAREGLGHLWRVDPIARTLEVWSSAPGALVPIASFEGDARVRAEPFEAVEIDLTSLWQDVVLAAAGA